MTGSLLKVTSTPFQAVRLSQSARLVSSDSVDVERRKAIARAKAFQSQHSGGSGMDLQYVNKINQTFSMNSAAPQVTAPSPQTGQHTSKAAPETASAASSPVSAPASAPADSGAVTGVSGSAIPENTVTFSEAQSAVSLESNAAYTMDRGAFEFRVAKGELAFLPPLNMTIITQRPEVHFEYTGGFHYVPASLFEDGSLNLSI